MRTAIRRPVRSAVRSDSGDRAADTGWDRRRVLAVLSGAVLAALVFLTGLGFAVYYALGSLSASGPSPTTGTSSGQRAVGVARRDVPAGSAQGRAYRDSVAGTTMLQVNPDSARQGVPSTHPAPTLLVPPATRTGPAEVPTGFPKNPAGAVGQLAAIEVTVLQGMSIPQVNDVHHWWTLTGAVGVAGWPLTRNVQAFLAAARQGQSKDTTVTVTVTPVAGMVKGVDGDDWVLACVLVDVQAVITTDARIAYGYCDRMQWTEGTDGTGAGGMGADGTSAARGVNGRWMIAPGPSSAPAPSTWPGTDLAAKAGWRSWVDAEHEAGPDVEPSAAPGSDVAAGNGGS